MPKPKPEPLTEREAQLVDEVAKLQQEAVFLADALERAKERVKEQDKKLAKRLFTKDDLTRATRSAYTKGHAEGKRER